jgi:Spy/CpxP family protein refolding chaperone
MKSVKRIAVAALTFCAVSAMGIAAQAAPSGPADDGRHHPGMESGQYAGDRHVREHGRKHERGHGDRDRYRQEKQAGEREIKRSPAFQVKVVIPGQHREPGYVSRRPGEHYRLRMHKSGQGFMVRLNLTANQKASIKHIRRAAKAEIAAVKSNPHLSFDAKKVRITSIRLATRNRIHSILSLEQKRQFDAHAGYGRG